jgi:hypothetical protein
LQSHRRLAERDLYSPNRVLEAWAHGTLAELELLSLFHDEGQATAEEVMNQVIHHCEKIVGLKGYDSFHVKSTRRQFQRYAEKWRLADEDWHRVGWTEIAEAAVGVLTPEDSPEAGE